MTANSIKYTDDIQEEKDFIFTEAGRCVACGLCLPHCPTYQLTQVEAESPRGRIALISALASGDLAPSETLENLLHHCLLCRACEKMCPSSVSFSMIMDKGRHLHKTLQKKPVKDLAANKLIDYLLLHPEWLRLAAYFTTPLSFLTRSKTDKADDTIQTKRTFLNYLPSMKPHKRWKEKFSTKKPNKQVSLFLGCVSRSMDGDTLDDAIYVLNKIGYSVVIPAGQVCCGALSLHAGRQHESLTMMQKNVHAFDPVQQLPIIYTASGCSSGLCQYHNYIEDNGFSSRLNEVCQFIDSHWPEKMNFSGQKQKILLHTPCSLENKSAGASAPQRLLSRFKNIILQATTSDYHCCGASGTKMLVDFNTSNALRDPILNQIKIEKPDVVVTSNIGCALHLAEGLRQAQLNIPVKHPVSLVADFFRANLQPDSKY